MLLRHTRGSRLTLTRKGGMMKPKYLLIPLLFVSLLLGRIILAVGHLTCAVGEIMQLNKYEALDHIKEIYAPTLDLRDVR